MTLKQTGWALGVLVVLGAFFGLWVSYMHPAKQAADGAADMLGGIATSTNSKEYTESTDLYTINIVYPAGTGLSAAADAKAEETLTSGLSSLVSQFKQDGDFANLTAEDIQIQGIGGDRKYALIADYKAYQGQGTVSYAFTIYEDTLGAHPNGFFKTFVFDQQGNQVGLADLLGSNPNWLEELSLVVSAKVEAELAARLGSILPQGPEGPDVTGVMYAEGVAPNVENFQNFAIDGDSFIFFIPPYQVAAYAAGSFEVQIPLSELR